LIKIIFKKKLQPPGSKPHLKPSTPTCFSSWYTWHFSIKTLLSSTLPAPFSLSSCIRLACGCLWAVLLAREPTELVRAIEILPRLVEDEMLAVVLADVSVSSWLFIELMSVSLRVVEVFRVVDVVVTSLVVVVVA